MPIDWLMIVFRLVLFGLLAYKITQLVKSHLIPLLKEELDLEHKQQTELFEKEKLLICTQHRLENQISSQKKTFISLDKSVHLWQSRLLQQKDENEHAAKQMLVNLDEKRKIQQQYLALAKDSVAIIPATCEQAAAELIKKFDGSDYGAQQLSAFITKLVSKPS